MKINLKQTKIIPGKNFQKLKIAVVKSNYYSNLTKSMEISFREILIESGVNEKNIQTFDVPGSWEIPLMAQTLVTKGKFDALAAFGVIIKGETLHFELIAGEVARSLMEISLNSSTPIIFEVLATFNLKQAEIRALGKNNKGVEAAKTLLNTIELLKKI